MSAKRDIKCLSFTIVFILSLLGFISFYSFNNFGYKYIIKFSNISIQDCSKDCHSTIFDNHLIYRASSLNGWRGANLQVKACINDCEKNNFNSKMCYVTNSYETYIIGYGLNEEC